MKKITLLFIFLVTGIASGQYNQNAPWMQDLENKQSSTTSKSSDTESYTIDEISASFDAYWKNHDPNKKGSGYKPFMRWKTYWEQLVGTDGKIPSSKQYWESYKNKIDLAGKAVNPTSNWTSIGPFSHDVLAIGLPGQGRVNAVAVDPNNANTWYLGAPAGGLWKSTDAGDSWTNLFDNFLQIGVSGIAIDPNNSNIIYISTGDDDASQSFSIGVFKSTDGGVSWNPTGLTPATGDFNLLMNEIVVDPSNSNTIWVGTNLGLQKSEDGGATWTIKQDGNITDFKLKPGDSQTIYAVGRQSYYVSVDGGENFTQVTENLPATSGRLALGVSPADPNLVYIISANVGSQEFSYQGLYKSTDSGASFVKTANTVDIFESNQAWFDLAIEVSPTNSDEVYIGCLNIWKSTNGGDNFSQLNQWNNASPSYTHADIHTLKFFNGKLFCGSDGGIYISDDNGTTFTDKTAGAAISQFYRISVAKNDAAKMAGGLQDNAGFLRNNGNWNAYTGGDGMDYEVDPNNNNLIYGFLQFGGVLYVTTDSGQTLGGIGAPTDTNGNTIQGNWVTPLAISGEGDVYAGFDGLYKLVGNAWEKSSSVGSDNFNLRDLEIDPNNPDIIYAAVFAKLYRSVNGGDSFNILNTFDSNISDIATNSFDSNIVYVTTSNEVDDPRRTQPDLRGVFKLTMDGTDVTVDEITANLPTDQAFFTIVHQGRNTTNPLYVGTNLGVYRIDDTLTEWEDYFTGFPNTGVSDLEISLDDGLITASTYGRGIWQSPVPIQLPDNDIRVLSLSPESNEVLCSGNTFIPELLVENKGLNAITEIEVSYELNDAATEVFTWTGNLASGNTTSIVFPTITDAIGPITLNATANIANDTFTDNNTASTNFVLNESSDENVTFTFENDNNQSLIIFNEGSDGSVWERGVPTGTLLNQASSGTQVLGTVLGGNHPDNTRGVITSRCYDLSNILAPTLKFNMAYDLEINFDIVFVEYSKDNGANWEVLGNINSQPNWYNSDRTNTNSGSDNDCQNCPGAQWTGTDATLTEYSYDFNINAGMGETDLTAETNIVFRIVFQSDPSVNQEGVIIDDLVVTSAIDDDDDDNDGVLDIDDNCSLVSNADQSDNDMDGLGDLCDTDDDNDGVLDLEDNCPLTANADQADFDGDGIGDICDDDIDNDGILNAVDVCPNTPPGVPVDVEGCEVFSLPVNNFRIKTSGESCISSNNGSISIEVLESLNYSATLSSGGDILATNTFTAMTSFNDLSAGNYSLCITLDEAPGYENCFDLTVTEPESLSVSSKVSDLESKVTLDLSGGDTYFISLNGKLTTTSQSQITLTLSEVENKISISTDKTCQGVHEETIFLSNELLIYPNPIEGGDLTIYLGNITSTDVRLSLFATNGTVLFNKSVPVDNSSVKLNVDSLSKGIYIINIKADGALLTYKMIRK
ncbi:thrombospondin type 3 repeat-containing protein [Maribacter sp. 2308TA10-17]|uniref:thrombospondin type 3 repeat-containing protein n=1 Tax=Maribacter sp. 2308TA10-17 TaxID=3386276 RepID=UPI0039BCE12F